MSLWWELRPSPASPTCSTFFKLHTAGPLLTEAVLLSSVARLLVSRSVDGGPIVFLFFQLLSFLFPLRQSLLQCGH